MPEIAIYLSLLVIIIALTIGSLFIKKYIVIKSLLHVVANVLTIFLSYVLSRQYFAGLTDAIVTSVIFFIAYAAVLAAILIPLRFLTKIPSFIFRKLLHFSCFGIVIPVSIICNNGLLSAFIIAAFAILIVNVLGLFDSYKWYSNLFVEKNPHEAKLSFAIFFILYAVLSVVAYWLHAEYLPVVAILAWGPGDAAAALIGIPFGKHKWTLRFVDSNKSIEGTIANAVTTFVTTLIASLVLCPIAWYWSTLIAVAIALICPMVELVSKKGIDTMTVPLTAFTILLLTII